MVCHQTGECPSDLGIFPEQQYSFKIVQEEEFKTVVVSLFPATFNTDTREMTLYQDVQISVNYSTPALGIVKGFTSDNKTYAVNETIHAIASIKNISSSDTVFSATVEIEDAEGNIVGRRAESNAISSNDTQNVAINLPAPDVDGSYTLNLSVSDGANVIGTSSLFIKVIAGTIVKFDAPAETVIEEGCYATFTVEFQNLFNTQCEAFEDIYIYNKQRELIAKLPQLLATLAAGETGVTETQWIIPIDLPVGIYKAQLVVTVGDAKFIKFSDITLSAPSIPGDLDGDEDVDRDDTNIIKAYLNQPASVCPECDIDGDGIITGLDARKLVGMCTCPRCLCP